MKTITKWTLRAVLIGGFTYALCYFDAIHWSKARQEQETRDKAFEEFIKELRKK